MPLVASAPNLPPVEERAALGGYIHLIVYDKPSPEAGGIENMAYWLARTLAGKGMRVVCAGREEYVMPLTKVSAVEAFPLKRAFRTTHTTDLRLLLLLIRLRVRYGRHVVLYSMVINNIKIYRLLRGVLGWRAVSFLHGNETLRLYHRRPETLRRNIEACDAVFANSAYTKGVVERLQPFPNVSVLSPGIPADRYRRDLGEEYRAQRGWQGRKVVLIMSRIIPRKGHATLIRAIAQLRSRHPELVLAIAGRGPYRAEIERLIAEAGLKRHVEWLGLVPEASKPALYGACDVFCMPSEESETAFETEGFGITFLEAAAAGAIAIGSRVGGIPDAIDDGKSGFLVEPGDADGLAKLLDQILTDPARFESMRRYARERALGFDWSSQVERMRDRIEEGIARAAAAKVPAHSSPKPLRIRRSG